MKTCRLPFAAVLVLTAAALSANVAGCAAPPSDDAEAAGGQAVSADGKTAYQGTVAGKDVKMRLERTGDTVKGTYFYADRGAAIALAGKVTGSRVTLTESVGGTTTGTFAGTLGRGGAISGTWSAPAGGAAQPFALTVITPGSAPGGTAILATRKERVANAAAHCAMALAYPEAFGLADAGVEAKVNAAIVTAARASSAGTNPACADELDLDSTGTVLLDEKGILSVGFDKVEKGGAHDNVMKTSLAVDLTTGKVLAFGDVFASTEWRKLGVVAQAILAARAATTSSADERAIIQDDLSPKYGAKITAGTVDFRLEKDGVRFSVLNDLPHVLQGADAEGVLVEWRFLRTAVVPGSAAAAFLPE